MKPTPAGASDALVDVVRRHCEERLARFKQPSVIHVVDELPYTVTGKVQKGRLRATERRRALGPAGVTARDTPAITLYAKPGCHLCEDAREVIERVCADVGTSYDEVDITTSTELMDAYGEQIPVTFVDGRQHDFWRVDEAAAARALADLRLIAPTIGVTGSPDPDGGDTSHMC